MSGRLREMVVGLIGVSIFGALATIGVQYSFGYFADEYQLTGLFDAAGQGLRSGSDVKVRGVDVGTVAGVELEEGRALVTLDIKSEERIPVSAEAVIRPKTLFGEKFVDLVPGELEGTGPYLQPGEQIRETLGGFELEQVLIDLYPILLAVDPNELAAVLGGLADAGRGLGPTINRTFLNSRLATEAYSRHDEETRRFLDDLALLAGELDARAGDLVAGARDLNSALPPLNARSGSLGALLGETARLSGDLADLFEANRTFLRVSLTEGAASLQVLFEERAQIRLLVDGLRMYAQTIAEGVRIPWTDGTLMAAVKGIMGGGEPCGQGQGESCLEPEGAPAGPAAAGSGPRAQAPLGVPDPGTGTPALPGVPGVGVPSSGTQAVLDLLGAAIS